MDYSLSTRALSSEVVSETSGIVHMARQARIRLMASVAFGFSTLTACSGGESEQGEPDSELSVVDLNRFAVASKYKIEELLRAPDTVEYRAVRIYRHPRPDGGVVFCGEVNAANGFGGMAGFERFVATPTHAVIESMGPAAFADGWRDMCPASRLIEPAPWF